MAGGSYTAARAEKTLQEQGMRRRKQGGGGRRKHGGGRKREEAGRDLRGNLISVLPIIVLEDEDNSFQAKLAEKQESRKRHKI